MPASTERLVELGLTSYEAYFAFDERHHSSIEAQPSEQLEVTRASAAKAEVGARDHDLRTDRPQHALGEHLRLEPTQVEIELDHERLLDSGLADQLQAPAQRRQQLDLVAERDPRMRVERDHGRRQPGGNRSLEHPPVAEVDAVEGSDRDRPSLPAQLADVVRDLHRASPDPAASSPIRPSASSGGMIRSASASSTRNGPTSVRRSVAQCPPSAAAIART